MKIIEIKKTDLSKELFENIVFFMFAKDGAMGEQGAINFVKKDGKLYHLNYMWGDINLEDVEEKFPTLARCKFSIFGIVSNVPVGWNYVNLGAGNHLIVTDEVYPQFSKLISNYKLPVEIYRDWLEHADYIINKNACFK